MAGLTTLAVAATVSAGVGVYGAIEQGKTAGNAQHLADDIEHKQNYYNNKLMGLINDPSSITKDPGYKFQFDQGVQAVERSSAAAGFTGSGNEATALVRYGQGYASSFLQQQEQLLASLSGAQNASSPSQALNAATGAQANSANTMSGALNALMYGLAQGSPGAGVAAAGPEAVV